MNAYLALVISILIGVCGQISLKAGSMQDVNNKYIFIHHYVILGLFLYFISALFYIYSIRVIPVSVAFPSVSVSYFAVALLAHLIWGEPFGLNQIASLILISSGIYMLFRNS